MTLNNNLQDEPATATATKKTQVIDNSSLDLKQNIHNKV
jgi:hypothetical protein